MLSTPRERRDRVGDRGLVGSLVLERDRDRAVPDDERDLGLRFAMKDERCRTRQLRRSSDQLPEQRTLDLIVLPPERRVVPPSIRKRRLENQRLEPLRER